MCPTTFHGILEEALEHGVFQLCGRTKLAAAIEKNSKIYVPHGDFDALHGNALRRG